jgi:hypothetical protein
MLTAHGRKPFVGKRKVVVGMAESNQVITEKTLSAGAAPPGLSSNAKDATLLRQIIGDLKEQHGNPGSRHTSHWWKRRRGNVSA